MNGIKNKIFKFKKKYTHYDIIFEIPKIINEYPLIDFNEKNLTRKKPSEREKYFINLIKKQKKRKLKILDIGAGSVNIKKIIESNTIKKVKLYVKDTKSCESKLLEIKKIKPNMVNFEIPKSLEILKNKNIDFVYFGSSFQYFLSPKKILNQIKLIKPLYICIFDNIFFSDATRKACIVNQTNLGIDSVYQKFHSLHEVREILNDKYILQEITELKKVKGRKHNKIKDNDYYNYNLIFKRF